MKDQEADSPFKPARRAALVFSALFVGLLILVFAIALAQK